MRCFSKIQHFVYIKIKALHCFLLQDFERHAAYYFIFHRISLLLLYFILKSFYLLAFKKNSCIVRHSLWLRKFWGISLNAHFPSTKDMLNIFSSKLNIKSIYRQYVDVSWTSKFLKMYLFHKNYISFKKVWYMQFHVKIMRSFFFWNYSLTEHKYSF